MSQLSSKKVPTPRNLCLTATLLLVCFGVLVPAQTIAAVGRTTGHFDVSTTGTATYTIPIFTPPGPNGMKPNIALAYNSGGEVGSVGRGWSIAGVPAISRCNRTTAQDANAAAVALATSDGYCLNGNRLRLTSGTYGLAGSIYQTEIADFSLVTAVGSAGSGPSSFTVKTKEGLTYEYGNTTDSRVLAAGSSTASAWMVSQISDRWGNRVKYTYATHGVGTAVPTKIEWAATSHNASTFVNEMTFAYGTNVPASTEEGYVAGTQYKNEALLNSISVSVSGTVRRKYNLTYGTSPTTNAKRLTSVQECSDDAGTDCLSATSISYQDGQAGTATTPQTTLGSAVSSVFTGFDFNGDGIEDVAYKNSGTWYIAMGSTSGLGSSINTGVTGELVPGDILGTGKDMFLAVSSGTWHAYSWNGSSFSGTSTGITTAASSIDISLADVNGDGKVDIVYAALYISTQVWMETRPNASTGSTVSFGTPVTSVMLTPIDITSARVVPPTGWTGSHRRFDFNGDLREDIALELEYEECAPTCNTGLLVYGTIAGDGYTYATGPTMGYKTIAGPTAHGYAVDINSDNCSDVLIGGALQIAKCNGGDSVLVLLSTTAMGSIDWDGDGRLDLLTRPTGSSTLWVSRANGVGFDAATNTGITVPTSCRALRADTDGDGLDELMCWEPGGSVKVYRHNSPGVVPDQATSFTDGFGIAHTVTYTPATWGNHTPQTNATYPNRDYQGPLQIVASVVSGNGIGGTYTRSYQYHGAAMNLQGRGFSGFAGRMITDSRTSAPKYLQNLSRTFPYTGTVTRSDMYSSGGTLLSRQDFTMAQTVLDSSSWNQRYFIYSSAVTSSLYEYGGALNGQLITQSAESRTYDIWGNLTASSVTTTDKQSTSPQYDKSWTESMSISISPDSGSNWCLGLPLSSTTTYSTTVSGEGTVVRSKAYTPDYVNCRHTEEVTEPLSSNRRVDVAYGYDSFGNVTTVGVKGKDYAGWDKSWRTTTINWGATGQFAASETDPLGYVTIRTYDAASGQVASETDPNGIVVFSKQFDSFRRISRVTRADGTSTVYGYHPCTSYGCKNGDPGSGLTSINKMVVVASERDTSDATFTEVRTYFDQLDRQIVESTRMLSGAFNLTGRQYDALGRVYRETAPCIEGSCTAYWVTNSYDTLGRLIQQSRPQSESVSTPVTTTFAFAGRTQTATDGKGKISTKTFDVMGRMRRSQDHDGYYQNFSYDAFGSLKQITDSLSNTLFSASYSYGIKAFQDSVAEMNRGTRVNKYNSLGELTQWTDAKGQNFTQNFDKLSRLFEIVEPEGAVSWNWGSSAGSYNIGRLASMSGPGYSESLTYDNKGRVTARSITTDQNYYITYAYNNQGRQDTVTWPTSTSSTRVKVKYGYDYGILKSITEYTGNTLGAVYWQANAQNSRGQIVTP